MASSLPRSFGDLLRRYRVAAGLTQEELAERAGLSRRAVGALETGERLTPHQETIALLVQALGLTTTECALFESAAHQRPPGAGAQTDPTVILATSRPGSRLPAHALVGRQNELGIVERLLAGDGPPLLILTGESGIGKSRLLEETGRLAQEQGWTVLAGGCHRRSGQEPYDPFGATLARFLATRSGAQRRLDLQGCAWLARLLPEFAEQMISPAASWILPPEQERRLLLGAVRRFLANIASSFGALLVLDDLHWAGDEANDLLAALLQESGSQSLRIVAAYRDTDVAAHDLLPLLLRDLIRNGLAARISLEPLARMESRDLLAELLGTQAGAVNEHESQAALVDTVLDRSSGLPFFLVSWAAEMRTGAISANRARKMVPWSAAESIRQRIAILPEGALSLLAVAAVAGHHVSRKVLLAAGIASGQSEADMLAGLDAACSARLLADGEDGFYAFTHDLIRETIVGDLGSARRASLHRCIAQALEAQPQIERHAAELAWRLAEGDEPGRARLYALQAGDYARDAYAHADAEQHYRMATQLARQLSDPSHEAEALERLGEVLYNLGRFNDALATFESAAALRKETSDFDRYAWDTAYTTRAAINLGQAAAGLERLQALLASLAALSPDAEDASRSRQYDTSVNSLQAQVECAANVVTARTLGRICLSLTANLVYLDRYEEAIPLGERAVDLARSAGEAWVQAHAHMFLGLALNGVGQLSRAASVFEAGGAVAEKVHALEGIILNYANLADLYRQRGAFDQALPLLTRSMEVAERFGAPEFIAQSVSALAELAYLMGEWDQAQAQCEHALEALRAHDSLTDTWWPTYLLGMLCLARGNALQARVYLDKAIARSERSSNFLMLRMARAAPAEQELLNGHTQMANEQLVPLFEQSPEQGDIGVNNIAFLPLMAWAHMDLDAMDEAETMLADGLACANDQERYLALVDLLRVQAILAMRRGRWAEARHALEEALARSRAMPYPYAEAKALYVSGPLQLLQQDSELAREHFTEALAILNRLGERLYAEQVERALARLAQL